MSSPFVPLSPLPALPAGYTVRPAREADAEELTALLNAHEADIGSGFTISLAGFVGDWAGADLEHDTLVVVAPDDSIAAYGDLNIKGDVLYSIYGYVLPEQRGQRLGTYLVAWGEQRAKSGAEAGASADARVVTRLYINQKNRHAIALLEELGYRVVRATLTMEIDPVTAGPPPALPDGLSIRAFVPGQDERAAYEVYEEAFADTWGRPRGSFEDFQAKIRRSYFDPALWFLVMDGDLIAGTLFSDDIDGEGWIEIVGVRRPWRGRGIAAAMLLHAFAVFRARGVRKVGLSVDAENPTGATRVYERAGMRLDQTLLVFERELRPGAPLSDTASE